MKYLKVGFDELAALAIIALASLLRLILVSLNWPLTNSDEGTIGIMALHIAYRGEHPIFFYGQNYMGPLEAYLGAGLFHLFGASLFTLRLGMVFCFALFLASTYLLTSLLYSKKMALYVLILLSLGSSVMLAQQLLAIGGYPETLFFGSLIFLLASWLALSAPSHSSPGRRVWRFIGYGCWGLVVGLAMWSDLIILPIVTMASLLLVLFCWRELLKGAILSLLSGLALGMGPLIVYNMHALPGQDSLTTLSQLRHTGHATLPQQISGTITVSLPTVTGNPFCLITDVGPPAPHTTLCDAAHLSWAIGAIGLWAIAVLLALIALWKLRSLSRIDTSYQEKRRHLVQQFARLMLLASAGLTLLLYMLSPSSAWWSSIHSHYLLGLLVATPAIICPLWQVAASKLSLLGTNRAKVSTMLCRTVLCAIGLSLLIGTVTLLTGVPPVEARNQQENGLIDNLLRIDATHIYTEYWTCDTVAFESQERIICGVLGNNLQPTHNRYLPYLVLVKADPNTAYVFPIGSAQASAITREIGQGHMRYRRFAFDGYVVFQPESSSSNRTRASSSLGTEHDSVGAIENGVCHIRE